MEYKKPAVDLTDLALGIVILGIVVTIGANVLVNLQGNRLTDLTTASIVNETLIADNVTADTLAQTWFESVGTVYNTSGGETVPASNYTVTVDDFGNGQFLLSGDEYQGENLSVNYDYYDTTSRADYTLAGDAATGLAEYGNWFDILVIVGVAAVILSLIFIAFGRQSGGNSGGVSY